MADVTLDYTWQTINKNIAESYENEPKDNLVWDDLRFNSTRLRVGALNKPDFDYTSIGLLFPQNDPSEKVYLSNQMPHGHKIGSALKPHIHYIQDEATIPVFRMDYRFYENGSEVPAFTSIDSTGVVFNYTSGSLSQIATFPDIDMTAITKVSFMLDVILYRIDNAVTGDVLLKEFDIHYQSDQIGSRQFNSK